MVRLWSGRRSQLVGQVVRVKGKKSKRKGRKRRGGKLTSCICSSCGLRSEQTASSLLSASRLRCEACGGPVNRLRDEGLPAAKPKPVHSVPKEDGQVRLGFGRYKGWLVSAVPDYYLRWMLENVKNLPKKVAKAAKRSLANPKPKQAATAMPTTEPVSGSEYVPYTGPATDIPWEE